ncbi:MAG: hypothetical protein HRU70_01020 [Phycisphaeraceae bacterium]|nr:MAG: hypothetical protein HRU70_01020 [Phycisphaeraceae bacterium]
MNGNVPIAGQGGAGGALLIDVVGNVTVEGWIKAGNGGSAARDNVNDAASRSIGKGGAGGVAEVKSGGAVLVKYTGLIAGGDGGGHDYPGAGGRVDVTSSGHVRNKGMIRGGNSHTIEGNRAGRLWAANHNGDGGKATVTSTNGNVILEQEAGTQTVAQVRGGNAGGASQQRNNGGYRGGGVSINAPLGEYSAERRGKSLVLPGDGGPPKGQGGKVEINAKKVVKIGHLGSGFDGDARHALAGASIAGVELVSADPLDEVFGRRIDVSVGVGGVFSAANDLLLGNARLNAMDRMTVSVGCGGMVDLGFMNTGPGAAWNILFNVDPTWPGDEGKLTITGTINQPDIGVFQFIRATVVEFGVGADFNDDGFIDFFDLDAYLTCFEQIECPPGRDSDMNGDGFADFFDLDLFLEAYESGAC